MVNALMKMKQLKLWVNDRELTFSENFFEKNLGYTRKKKSVQTLRIGGFFEVNPVAINQQLFKKRKRDPKQEKARQIIIEAIGEMEKNPIKYARKFKTAIPEKTWVRKTVKEMMEFAEDEGGHMADWIEQALEWAQRITNGETWESICNDEDDEEWYRLVMWKDRYARYIGGAKKVLYGSSADVIGNCCGLDYSSACAVPLIVFSC